MVNSVINEGSRGLQLAQREIARSANEIARTNVNEVSQADNVTDADATALSPVDASQELASQRDISEPLVELRRQEQIFNANAKVVSIANETIGSLIDVRS